jgi:hypothetical protein
MSYSLIVNWQLALTARETLGTNVPAASKPTLVHDAFNSQGTMQTGTTPPATKFAAFQKALVAGVGTIDLTALTGTNGVTVDGTGLKVQAIRIQNPSTNTRAVIVQPGASNGYNIFGGSSLVTINPGEEIVWIGNDSANVPDVGSSAKNIGLSDGASGTDSCNYEIVLG